MEILGRGAADTAVIRVFAEPWTTGSQYGTITGPMLIAEVRPTDSGEFETSFRTIGTSEAIVGTAFYAWDIGNQVRSILVCFTFMMRPERATSRQPGTGSPAASSTTGIVSAA